jgi:type I restriction enzyme M protein
VNVENLRFSSSDSHIRREIVEVIGDEIFTDFSSVKVKLEELLDEENQEEGEDPSIPNISAAIRKRLLDSKKWERDYKLYQEAKHLQNHLGTKVYDDHNSFVKQVTEIQEKSDLRLSASDMKMLLRNVSWRDENAPAVIKKIYAKGKNQSSNLLGKYTVLIDQKEFIAEYEIDSELSDFELVPLNYEGGIEKYMETEVLPFYEDAWVTNTIGVIGYEVSFTRNFYKKPILRSLSQVNSEITKLLKESEGAVAKVLGFIDSD